MKQDTECSNNDENDAISLNEDSLDKSSVTIGADLNNDDDVTNDSVITSDSTTNDSVETVNKQRNSVVLDISEETCSSFLEPPNKKVCFCEVCKFFKNVRNVNFKKRDFRKIFQNNGFQFCLRLQMKLQNESNLNAVDIQEAENSVNERK